MPTPPVQRVKQFPMHVTIPTPMHIPIMRGKQAPRGPHSLGAMADNLRVRFTVHDRKLVDKMVIELGMHHAEYIRWCALEVAKALETEDS